MEISDEMLIEISYVEISKYRKKVMKSLDGDVKIPTAIAKDSGKIVFIWIISKSSSGLVVYSTPFT